MAVNEVLRGSVKEVGIPRVLCGVFADAAFWSVFAPDHRPCRNVRQCGLGHLPSPTGLPVTNMAVECLPGAVDVREWQAAEGGELAQPQSPEVAEIQLPVSGTRPPWRPVA
ncbi:hypothetical protein [Nocardia xishanensis]|uniref:hypothetical protein n=1 Tax=Nocardia xishanensis TaxID=238964 RepID=UPI00340D2E59